MGQPYVGLYGGNNCVVVFDQAESGILKGRVYIDDGNIVTKHICFTSYLERNGSGKLYYDVDGFETKIDIKKVSLLDGQLKGDAGTMEFVLNFSNCSSELPFKAEYKEAVYDCFPHEDITYVEKVRGYWMKYPASDDIDENDYGTIYANRIPKLLNTNDLELNMDLYRPVVQENHGPFPLLLLIHGGAFYNGDKRSLGFPEMGEHFAKRGYVVASINYRLGFWPWCQAVDRAGYRAVQDANAAVRYLLSHKEELNIDPDNIFVAGSSAGAITALNLAFMDENYRPKASFGVTSDGFKGFIFNSLDVAEKLKQKALEYWEKGVDFVLEKINWLLRFINLEISPREHRVINYLKGTDLTKLIKTLGLDYDLGDIDALPIKGDASGSKITFKVKGVVNMWGAVHDLDMLSTSPNTSILSFHGTDDHVVPYGYGYPFDGKLDEFSDNVLEAVSFNNDGIRDFIVAMMPESEKLNELAFRPMYGSAKIDGYVKAGRTMRRSELHTVEGGGHSLYEDEHNALSQYFYDTIVPVMTRFLCEEIVGGKTVRLEQKGSWFEAVDTENVAELRWQVEGGVVVGYQGDHKANVLFFDDATTRSVSVGGQYKNGVEFRERINVE